MLIRRHINFIDTPAASWRQELRYDPPLEIDLSLGKISPILNSEMAPKGTSSGSLRKCKPIINANGILHINEVMKAGETLSIVLRPGHCLNDIVLRDTNELLVLADEQGLIYWFTTGQDGVLEIVGNLVKEGEGIFAKLKSNLKDIPFRSYIGRCSLADSKTALEVASRTPDLMSTKEAAKYLGKSDSWVYKRAASGEIPRTRHGKYRKSDLDAYISRGPRSK